MKLADFMKLSGLSDADLAAKIGRSRETVTRYRNGTITPNWEALAALTRVTNGAVTANDFLPDSGSAMGRDTAPSRAFSSL
jgi:transcriptional regulator with XRE-family HTH domain